MRYTILILVVLLNSCYDNTSDPQMSESIEASIKNGFFISKYSVQTDKSICQIPEAWVEYSWKYEVHGMNEIKKKTEGMQLVLAPIMNDTAFFNPIKYLNTWALITASDSNGFGLQGNRDKAVYFLFLPSKKIPDSLTITICKQLSDSFPVFYRRNKKAISTIKLNKISN